MMRMLDLLLKGGTIIDGTGRPRFVGDVGILGGKIVEVSQGSAVSAHQVIDVTGCIVSPGFIDVHAHDDLAVLHDETMASKLTQGVTTTIVGNCGLGPVPASDGAAEGLRSYVEPVLGTWPPTDSDRFGFPSFNAYISAIQQTRHSLNISSLVGHGALRILAKGFSSEPPTAADLGQMVCALQEAMNAGALGLSLGLMYAPGCFAPADELVELAKVVRQNGGVVTAHIRGEGNLLLASVKEMIDLGLRAGVPIHISHLKAVGKQNWGHVTRAIECIQAAREAGQDVTCDVYPYTAGSTTITSLLPPFVLEGGVNHVLEQLTDPVRRSQVRAALERPGEGWDNVALLTGFDQIVLASTPSPLTKRFVGQSFAEIAKEIGTNPIDAYFEVMCQSGASDTIIVHHMSEDDVVKVVQFEHAAIGSDGLPSQEGHPHPRLYGTFPRYLSHYVREKRLLTLEEAIRKITLFSARRFNLGHRGYIGVGAYADIAVFDFDKIIDKATYARPRQLSEGVSHVIVNGKLTVDGGTSTNTFTGRFLPRG